MGSLEAFADELVKIAAAGGTESLKRIGEKIWKYKVPIGLAAGGWIAKGKYDEYKQRAKALAAYNRMLARQQKGG